MDFNNTNNIIFNSQQIDIYDNKLCLALGSLWTNTPGELSGMKIPSRMDKDRSGNIYYACCYIGSPPYITYKSSNSGQTWDILYNDSYAGFLHSSGDNNIYIGFCYNAVLKKSYDRGASWVDRVLPYEGIKDISEDNDHTLYMSVYSHNNVPVTWYSNWLLKSYDYGTNWNLVYKQYSYGFQWLYHFPDNRIAAGKVSNGGGIQGLFISMDRGTNWSLIPETEDHNFTYGAMKDKDGIVYAYGPDGLIATSDQGQSWKMICSEQINRFIQADNTLFYTSMHTNIYRSWDKGYHWRKLPSLISRGTNFSHYAWNSLLQAQDSLLYTGGAFSQEQGKVFTGKYISKADVILNFKPLYVYQWQDYSVKADLNSGKIIYSIRSSLDNGRNWSSWQELTRENLLNLPCAADGNDRLQVRASLYSYRNIRTPVIKGLKLYFDPGKRNDLSQVALAPNPVHYTKDKQVVFFFLPEEFDLTVYSVAGGKIAGYHGQTDNGQYTWDLKNDSGKVLKSGVYICRLKDRDGHSKDIKLVFIK